jgi:hypothetical protein
MHLPSLRRLVLGAAITGTAIGAVPAVASAASTCGYFADQKQVNVIDDSGTLPLHIVNANELVAIKDGPNGTPIFCGGSGNIANTGNTNLIHVHGPVSSNVDGLVVDRSAGVVPPDITMFNDANRRPSLKVIGRAGDDTMKVASGGVIDFDNNGDIDVRAANGANFVTLNGGDGQDLLSGESFGGFGNSTVRLFLNGGAGADDLIGGLNQDDLNGGSERDVFHAINGANDVIFGGPGFDVANADKTDRFSDVVEKRFIEPIGQLKLAPRVLKAEAGMISRLNVGWKHPQSWRELRKLKVSLYDGKQAVGMINVRPASERVTSTGAVDLKAARCKVGHHGKWVNAKLWMSLPKSLAGQDLRVDVQATDKNGDKQLVRAAGTVRVVSMIN